MIRFFFYLSLISLAIGVACSHRKSPLSSAVAVVNGEAITLGEFRKELATAFRQEPFHDDRLGSELKADLINKLVQEKLILQEAGKRNITVSDEEVEKKIERIKKDYPGDSFDRMIVNEFVNADEWRAHLRNDILIGKVTDQAVGENIAVSEKDARAFYDAHAGEYKQDEQVRARQILTATEDEAKEVVKRLRRGEDFKAVAASVSISPDRDKGGDLGFFPRGQMPPEFDEACFSLPPGKFSGIVKSPYGYHIFLIEERRKGRRLGFSDVKEKIMERLVQEKREAAVDEWVKQLRGKSQITVNAPLLKDS